MQLRKGRAEEKSGSRKRLPVPALAAGFEPRANTFLFARSL
jgi:hypothetical protein